MTSRGDRRESIYRDDSDRVRFLEPRGEVVLRLLGVHACLMGNHFPLLIETPDANRSKGMRPLNGVFIQYTNRRASAYRASVPGPLQGLRVDAHSCLLELSRYVVLTRWARMVADAGTRPGASTRSTSPSPLPVIASLHGTDCRGGTRSRCHDGAVRQAGEYSHIEVGQSFGIHSSIVAGQGCALPTHVKRMQMCLLARTRPCVLGLQVPNR